MPIVNRQTSFPVLGRVALGYLKATDSGKTYPARSETMVFSADDEALLRHVATILGGTVEPVPSADEEEGATRYRVISSAKELHIRLPADDDRAFQQWMERWGRGGLVRRCDGVTCQFAVPNSPGDPAQRDVPCICEANELPTADRCDPTTRLNVVVEELFTVPRMGLWQITSRGFDSSREIASTVALLRAGGAVVGVPLLLRVDERSRRAKDGKTYEFPVFTLIPLISFAQAASLRGRPPAGFLPAGTDSPTLSPGERVAPGTTPSAGGVPTKTTSAPHDSRPASEYTLLTPDRVTGANDAEKLQYLRQVAGDYMKGLGVGTAQGKRIWDAIGGGAAADLSTALRYYNVLAAMSIGVSETDAINHVKAAAEDVPF